MEIVNFRIHAIGVYMLLPHFSQHPDRVRTAQSIYSPRPPSLGAPSGLAPFDIDARSRRLASSKAFPFELKARGSWQSVNRVLWDLGGIAFLLLMVAIRMGRDYLLVRGLIHLFSKNTLGRRCAALSARDFDWPPQAPTKP